RVIVGHRLLYRRPEGARLLLAGDRLLRVPARVQRAECCRSGLRGRHRPDPGLYSAALVRFATTAKDAFSLPDDLGRLHRRPHHAEQFAPLRLADPALEAAFVARGPPTSPASMSNTAPPQSR